MLELTTTDNAALGIKQTQVKLTLPVIEITCYKSATLNLNPNVKSQLLYVIGEMLDKELSG